MKVQLDSDEWYPVYSIVEKSGDVEVELDEPIIERIKAATAEFLAVQALMADAYEAARAKVRPDSRPAFEYPYRGPVGG